MQSKIFSAIIVAASAFLLPTFIQPPSTHANEGTVNYPDGYRAWTFLHGSLVTAGFPGFVKSPCEKPCTNGMLYYYANEGAMKGLRTGTYPEGAVIAEEMLAFGIGEKGMGGEGRRVLTAVMIKDSRLYESTGGWGFGNFYEGSKENTLDAKAQQACFQCHVSRKDHGYVFSQYSER
jgi:hypothetical protein